MDKKLCATLAGHCHNKETLLVCQNYHNTQVNVCGQIKTKSMDWHFKSYGYGQGKVSMLSLSATH